MKCKDVCDLMSEYIDECLDEHRRMEVEAHLNSCTDCASELRAMKAMLVSLSGLSGRRSPVDCWTHVHEVIIRQELAKKAWWHWLLKPAVAAPAVALTALLTLLLVWPQSTVAPPPAATMSNPEYGYYIGAHSHLQRQQAFTDPDVTFVRAELETASLSTNTTAK